MKFSTSKTELQNVLQKLSKAVPTRSTLPILGCVLFKASEEKTILRATDLEITIIAEIPVSIEEPGSAAIPLKTLLDITNELPETRITLIVDSDNKIELRTETGVYDLMGKPANEFPSIPDTSDGKELSMNSQLFKSVIESTVFAVSRDDLKPALTGVLFRFNKNNLTAVSTDGHRLVKHIRKDFVSTGFVGDVIVPKKFLNYMILQLASSNDDVGLIVGENHMTAITDKVTVLTRTIDERFPDYESVIPSDNTKKLITDKSDLSGAIRRVSIFSNKTTRQVALNLSDKQCLISTEDPEKSSKAQEEITAEYTGDGLTIGYNAEYLKDVINHVDGQKVVISLNTPISAALFNSEDVDENVDSTMLLMPIRLND